MAGGIVTVVSSIVLSACSVFGVRTVEEPAYRVVAQAGAVEIRAYGPRLAAEALEGGDEMAARSAGFRRVAAYIFGANQTRASIAMTAPVAQDKASASIAMTAPVDQTRDASGKWRIRFFMPASYTEATLPVPTDPGVQIVTVPPQTIAVLRYAGVPSESAVQTAAARLLGALGGSGWHAIGAPMAWFYDPPWTLPPLRRNEAAVAVARD